MYRIIYYKEDDQSASWEFDDKTFNTAHEAHEFALENYFYSAFHVVKICLITK